MKLDSNSSQNFFPLGEMLAAGFVQILADARESLDDGLVFGNFAVEHAQRIGHGPALAVAAHFVFHRFERLPQSFVITCPAASAAHGIEFQPPLFYFEAAGPSPPPSQPFTAAPRRIA